MNLATPQHASPQRAWKPLSLLARFRARVTSLTSRDSRLPVRRKVTDADAVETSAYTCDVACFCADATPAEVLIRQRMDQADSQRIRNTLAEIYQRLHAMYSIGAFLPHRYHAARLAADAARNNPLPSEQRTKLIEFVAGPLNDAFCREQALSWLAQSGLQLSLYGAGWSHHPQLAEYAREFSGTFDQLSQITRTARINLRLTPCLANDPFLAQAIDSESFLLMRFFPEDVVERIYRPLHAFCRQRQIFSDEQLQRQATKPINELLQYAGRTLGTGVFEVFPNFIAELQIAAKSNFSRTCGSMFSSEYDAIAFGSRDELLGLIKKFLNDVPERRRIAGAMRQTLSASRISGSQTTRAEAPSYAQAVAAGEVAA